LVDVEPQLNAGTFELVWRDDFGNPIPQNFEFRSEGSFSSEIASDGWTLVSTPSLDTRTLTRVGDRVALDVRVPSEQLNPYWIGDVQLYAHIPSAGISNQWLGYQSLDQLPLDTWSTVEFELPEGIVEALSGAYPDAQFLVTANLASNLAPLLIDHIRFSGQQVV